MALTMQQMTVLDNLMFCCITVLQMLYLQTLCLLTVKRLFCRMH